MTPVTYPHWARIQRMPDETRRRWVAVLIRRSARAIAPEFASTVEQRDRWLDDLGSARRTWHPIWQQWHGSPFAYVDVRGME